MCISSSRKCLKVWPYLFGACPLPVQTHDRAHICRYVPIIYGSNGPTGSKLCTHTHTGVHTSYIVLVCVVCVCVCVCVCLQKHIYRHMLAHSKLTHVHASSVVYLLYRERSITLNGDQVLNLSKI